MPILIGAVFVGLVVFFVKTAESSRPAGAADTGVISGSTLLPGDAGESRASAHLATGRAEDAINKTDPAETARPADGSAHSTSEAPPASGLAESSDASDVGTDAVSLDLSKAQAGGVAGVPRDALESLYTSWMSPTALDTYIRARNAGYTESFWKRGHWIPAVEGRWQRGVLEFRIVVDAMPYPDAWHWQYRINQTEAEFSRIAYELQEQGFHLEFHQVFLDGASTRRVQAVWRRFIRPADVVER